ncbi:unnamed protein product [Trifolium pratense]|uniref:Uncharacterized protein n=1 Tax=Trifolium pratense TaxID=57577 RepID=A0ACB0IYE7_TRIPR|nr:unnamed protein product [Trifolium pratense]
MDQISAAKELFQLLSACSVSVGGSKSVALLAPVVFMMHSVVKELFGKELRLKKEKKAMKKVKSLVVLVLGVFEDDTLRSHAKLCLDISQMEQPVGTLDGKVTDDGIFNVSEENKEKNLISDAFVEAAQTMKSSDNESRKRKGKNSGKKIKFSKYELNQNAVPVKAGTSTRNDSSSDESEVQDPNSDADA